MLRLIIAAALLLPALAHGVEPVPPELKVRDLIPGWTPVRPLPEDQIAIADSPHEFKAGGFPVTAPPYLVIRSIPLGWIKDWPDPPPLEATGVPWGWWWKPQDPKWLGSWLVFAIGHSYAQPYILTTRPLRAIDDGPASGPATKAAQALYATIRDREAKRRGVTPDALDREADLLVQYGRIPSAFETAIPQARRLYLQDRLDDALHLLEMTLEESVGTEAERAEALMYVARIHFDDGRMKHAQQHIRRAQPLAEASGGPALKAMVADLAKLIEDGFTMTPGEALLTRGIGSYLRSNPKLAVPLLLQALPHYDGAQTVDEMLLHSFLARALHATGEPSAEPHARRALKLATQWEREEHIAEMKALLGKLSPPKRP